MVDDPGQQAETSNRVPSPATSESEAHRVWREGLDQFERRLDEFRAVLEPDGQPPVGIWPPPELMGHGLPVELADRARELLERARLVEGELVARRTELPAPQRAPVRHRRRPISTTVFTAL